MKATASESNWLKYWTTEADLKAVPESPSSTFLSMAAASGSMVCFISLRPGGRLSSPLSNRFSRYFLIPRPIDSSSNCCCNAALVMVIHLYVSGYIWAKEGPHRGFLEAPAKVLLGYYW